MDLWGTAKKLGKGALDITATLLDKAGEIQEKAKHVQKEEMSSKSIPKLEKIARTGSQIRKMASVKELRDRRK